MNEIPHRAMAREYKEETGVSTSFCEWRRLGKMTLEYGVVRILYVVNNAIVNLVEIRTCEQVEICNIKDLPRDVVLNIKGFHYVKTPISRERV